LGACMFSPSIALKAGALWLRGANDPEVRDFLTNDRLHIYWQSRPVDKIDDFMADSSDEVEMGTGEVRRCRTIRVNKANRVTIASSHSFHPFTIYLSKRSKTLPTYG
jgi:hypothetical protein